jgi:hypothetical protein
MKSNNVINFYAHSKTLPTNSAAWMLCPVCHCDGCFAPIIVGNEKREIEIRSLVCVSEICAGDTLLDVQNGILTQVE